MTELVVRPSSLADFSDCPRRWATRNAADLLASAGYTLPQRDRRHVGAAVGTGLHAAAEHVLVGRMQGGEPLVSDAEERGIEAFRAEVGGGAMDWDDTTPEPNTAEKQLRRMTRAWHRVVAPKIVPVAIEERLDCEVAEGLIASGKPDILDQHGNMIAVRDIKSSRIHRSPHMQMGAYGLILHSHGYEVAALLEDHIPRVRIADPQPEPVTAEIALRSAIEDAHAAMLSIKRAVDDFRERAANPRGPSPIAAFAPNPASRLCSARWCPAWGTAACRASMGG
jgi:hypothetical protein